MNEQAIFLAALGIRDPQARNKYVERACADQPALERRVQSLLAEHDRPGEFIEVPILEQFLRGGLATGGVDGQPSPTRELKPGDGQELNLWFLQPSSKSGSLGRLAHYEVEGMIGRGGCGVVLKAFDELLHRTVAIKIIAPEISPTSPARKRFLREARSAAAISHENVVSIYAVDDQPIPFLVMEYIAGPTLQQMLDGTGPLEELQVAQIGQQIAAGLEAAHSIGLIHRDIKPGNILLDARKNRFKITDFGLARAVDDASLTQSGAIAGTPLYMSPEQAQGAVIDKRSDLFSLGAVLYAMCTGRPPFRAGSTVAILKRVVEDEPRPIRDVIPEVSDWLDTVVTRLLAKAPADRFPSAGAVAELLSRHLSEANRQEPELASEKELDLSAAPVKQNIKPAEKKAASYEHPALHRASYWGSRRLWTSAIAAALIMIAGLGISEGSGVTSLGRTVVRLLSAEGTLIVEIDDPQVSVQIDGEDLVISGTGAKEIRLRPGDYEVVATKDGQVLKQEIVEVARNGRRVVRVSKEAGPATAVPGATSRTARVLSFDKNSLGMEFVLVPKGSSWLGGGDGKLGEKELQIPQDFYLGVNVVTQKEWNRVMGENPSHFSRQGEGRDQVKGVSAAELEQFPVEMVSWEDCGRFITRLNEEPAESDWHYRLPTEDEWEYACRGGPQPDKSLSAFDFYLDKPKNFLLPTDANFGKGPTGQPCRVGQFVANPLGLHDMHGNVHQWCDTTSPDAISDGQAEQRRPLRGGSFFSHSHFCRAANRFFEPQTLRQYNCGLRLARVRAVSKTDQTGVQLRPGN